MKKSQLRQLIREELQEANVDIGGRMGLAGVGPSGNQVELAREDIQRLEMVFKNFLSKFDNFEVIIYQDGAKPAKIDKSTLAKLSKIKNKVASEKEL